MVQTLHVLDTISMHLGTIVGACISVCTPSEVHTHVRLSSIGSALGSIRSPSVGGPIA